MTIATFFRAGLMGPGHVERVEASDGTQATIAAGSAKATPVDADQVVIVDSADASKIKRLTWANLKSVLGAVFATVAQGAKADTAVQPGILAPVATAGTYSSLTGKPTLGSLAAKNKAAISDLDTTGAASGTTVLAGSGAWVEKGFKQIATASSTGAAVSFTSIPQGYDELLVVFDGVSHDNGSNTTIGLKVSSDNGGSYSSALAVSSSVAASASLSGVMSLDKYSGAVSSGFAQIGVAAASPALTGPTAISVKGDHAGGVNAIQFLPAAGAFDAGTITLFAR